MDYHSLHKPEAKVNAAVKTYSEHTRFLACELMLVLTTTLWQQLPL